jgi:hypothetical protein
MFCELMARILVTLDECLVKVCCVVFESMSIVYEKPVDKPIATFIEIKKKFLIKVYCQGH